MSQPGASYLRQIRSLLLSEITPTRNRHWMVSFIATVGSHRGAGRCIGLVGGSREMMV